MCAFLFSQEWAQWQAQGQEQTQALELLQIQTVADAAKLGQYETYVEQQQQYYESMVATKAAELQQVKDALEQHQLRAIDARPDGHDTPGRLVAELQTKLTATEAMVAQRDVELQQMKCVFGVCARRVSGYSHAFSLFAAHHLLMRHVTHVVCIHTTLFVQRRVTLKELRKALVEAARSAAAAPAPPATPLPASVPTVVTTDSATSPTMRIRDGNVTDGSAEVVEGQDQRRVPLPAEGTHLLSPQHSVRQHKAFQINQVRSMFCGEWFASRRNGLTTAGRMLDDVQDSGRTHNCCVDAGSRRARHS